MKIQEYLNNLKKNTPHQKQHRNRIVFNSAVGRVDDASIIVTEMITTTLRTNKISVCSYFDCTKCGRKLHIIHKDEVR
jgi:hypothetical protein